MAKEYIIITKQNIFFCNDEKVDKVSYAHIAKNKNAVVKKTKYLGAVVDANNQPITTYLKPVGYQKHDNRSALQKIKVIKDELNTNRDREKNPVTWATLLSNVEIQHIDSKNDNYYDNIDKVWGMTERTSIGAWKSFIKRYFDELRLCTIKQAYSNDTIRRFKKVLENCFTNKSLKKATIYKRWSWHINKLQAGFVLEGMLIRKYDFREFRPSGNILRVGKPTRKFGATSDELKKLRDVKCEGDIELIRKGYLFSALYTGLRYQTMNKLKWKHITDAKDEGFYRLYMPNQIKDNTIDLDLLFEKDELSFELIGKRKDNDDYVFTFPRKDDGSLKSSTCSQKFNDLKKIAGIDNNNLKRSSCRHTHAYIMLKATKNDILKVANRLGHTSHRTTLANYVGMTYDYYLESVQQLKNADKFDIPDQV